MLKYLKSETNLTRTENGAVTYKTSGSDVLDLFSAIGAMRSSEKEEIISRFIRAYTEDKDLAMKLLFFARDIRGGLGERRVFRILLTWLGKTAPKTVIKNLHFIESFGRYDDFLVLLDTPCEKDVIIYLKHQLEDDICHSKNNEPVSLLAKWLPSVNASNKETIKTAKKLAAGFHMSESQYRKTLTCLRKRINLIENDLREKNYAFDYGKIPSRAHFKYRNAFIRNDLIRYQTYLSAVNTGINKIHTANCAPYEFVQSFLLHHHSMTEEEKLAFNTMWEALPNYGNNENTLAVIDTSGSMHVNWNPSPAAVALSLGQYFAERNTGIFKNHFIEFSSEPELIEIKGDTFIDRLQYLLTFNKVADTNLEAVFDLILNTAVTYQLPKEDLPSKLVIISDMEFNTCMVNADITNFESAKLKYAAYGYQLPDIVFWNVASRSCQMPVTMNEQGVTLVSGCSVQLFEMVAGKTSSPYQYMLDILQSDRYAQICA